MENMGGNRSKNSKNIIVNIKVVTQGQVSCGTKASFVAQLTTCDHRFLRSYCTVNFTSLPDAPDTRERCGRYPSRPGRSLTRANLQHLALVSMLGMMVFVGMSRCQYVRLLGGLP